MSARLRRIFAPTIIFQGHRYQHSVAELDTDSGNVRIFPFEQELHSTRYISGEVTLEVGNGDFIISTSNIPHNHDEQNA